MPPKPRINKEMVLEAATEVVRRSGIEAMNVRSVATELKCSTQPVMYHFDTMEDLRKEVYNKAVNYHSQYIFDVDFHGENPALDIAKRYVLFAAEEPQLFRFLFQSPKYVRNDLRDIMQGERMQSLVMTIGKNADLSPEQARDAFAGMLFSVHGIASLVVNRSIEYNEEYCERVLSSVFCGAIDVMRQENQASV